jgi:hypothetical protein
MNNEILDAILLPLADLYESGKPRWQQIDPASPEEYEPLRECLAELRAEGSLRMPHANGPFQLTAEGYQKYLPRIKALRTFA